MAVSNADIDQAKDLFAPLGEIRVRRMFGGAGVYCDDLFFAILDDGGVFLKADKETRRTFERAGLAQFCYESGEGEMMRMNYYAAPDAVFDDETELRKWTGLALDAARRAKK
ncbi:MAG: TfoX/Sxy family protein [Parvularculaceae bacterium]